ncbi:MAG: hypothetical protein L3J35_12190 [Bacteroidales bacterium]|nr:hypothetical protein [Bacteroidales bacterium]
MKKLPLFLFLIISIFVFSCKNNEDTENVQEFSFPKENFIVGLASPVNLRTDTTTIFLKDYIPQDVEIIEIKTHEAIQHKLSKDSLQIKLIIISDDLPKLSFLKLNIGYIEYSILLKKSEKIKQQITFNPQGKTYKKVQIKGEINAWNPNNTNLVLKNGIWEIEFEIDPGTYQYLFVIDGREMLDPANPDKINTGMGNLNSVLKAGLIEDDKLPQIFTDSYSPNIINITYKNNITELLATYRNFELDKSFFNLKEDTFQIVIPKDENEKDLAYIRIWAYNDYGVSNDLLIPIKNGQVLTDAKKLTRSDFHSAILYNTFVDRFNDGNPANNKPTKGAIHPKANFHGGDIAGIIQKIEDGYFDDLGINTIWISPVVKNPEGAWGMYLNPKTKFSAYRGYWPVSFTKVDERFGTEEELKQLVEKAHKHNLNVLLDFVANHVHQEHPIYQQHKDWATSLYLPDGRLNTELWDEQRLTTWFDVFLPTLDLSNPKVYNMLSDSAVYWIKKYNLDGFRHDATKHIPEIFWRTLTQKLKIQVEIPQNKKLFQIGATYGSPELISSYVNTGQLDAQFDFNVYDAMVSAITENGSFENLARVLKTSQKYYGSNHLMGNITGNQDRGRFISYASGSLRFDEDAKLAGWTREVGVLDTAGYKKCAVLNAIVSTIPGIPVIFYGDEIGIPGGSNPDNQKMMRFDNLILKEKELKGITKKLLHFRKSSMPLMFGDLQIIEATETGFIFSRNYFNETVYVIINSGKENKTFEIKTDNKNLKALFKTNFTTNNNGLEIILGGNSFEILKFRE